VFFLIIEVPCADMMLSAYFYNMTVFGLCKNGYFFF